MSDSQQRGQAIRREVLGAAFVDANVAQASPFYQQFVAFTSTQCWDYIWRREGLDRRTRSLLNLAMLAATARWNEFALHVRGALNNGVSEQEIAEVLLQAGVYAGVPVASEGFKLADVVIAAWKAEQAASAA